MRLVSEGTEEGYLRFPCWKSPGPERVAPDWDRHRQYGRSWPPGGPSVREAGDVGGWSRGG